MGGLFPPETNMGSTSISRIFENNLNIREWIESSKNNLISENKSSGKLITISNLREWIESSKMNWIFENKLNIREKKSNILE